MPVVIFINQSVKGTNADMHSLDKTIVVKSGKHGIRLCYKLRKIDGGQAAGRVLWQWLFAASHNKCQTQFLSCARLSHPNKGHLA
nr:MAG TPA: hypothetical protein [Caudoviricetes sp.]